VGDFTLGDACGKGGFSDAKVACCKVGPKPIPPPDPGGPVCFGDAQGGPTSCKPAEVWTKYASDLCVAKGSKISHISFAEDCGKGSFRWTKYECCDGSQPPPPPPPPVACKTDYIGGKCLQNGAWKAAALDICAASKRILADLSLGASCGPDSSSEIKVTCCDHPPAPPPDPTPYPPKDPVPPQEPPKDPGPPPSPPPSSCIAIYGEKACHDPGTWKQVAHDHCSQQGLTLNDLSFIAPCGANGGTSAKYTCCKP
jgi:hypothetical protein